MNQDLYVSERGASKPLSFLFVLLVVLGAALLFLPGKDPAAALRTAYQTKDAEQAMPLLTLAKTNPALRPWALLREGKLLLEAGKKQQAAARLQAIDRTSAASLDADIELFSLSKGKLMERSPQQISDALVAAKRADLVPSWRLAVASRAHAEGQASIAYHNLQELRRDFPNSLEAKKAKELVQRIGKQHPGLLSPAAELEEAKLLLREGSHQEALELLELLAAEFSAASEAYFEVMLVKQTALRRLGADQDADQLLAVIAADAPPGTAQEALLALIKNSWNANEQQAALQFIEKFKTRFPGAVQIPEVRYIEGRIHEELQDTAKAQQSYRSILQSAPDSPYAPRAVRQLAWIHLRANEYEQAAEQLQHDALSPADEQTALSSAGILAQSEELHRMYWLALAARKAAAGQKSKLLPDTEPEQLLRTVAEKAPNHYYGRKARALLGLPAPSSPTPTEEQREQCRPQLRKQDQDRLLALQRAEMPELGRKEVNWLLYRLSDQLSEDQDENEIRIELFRALLLAQFNDIADSLAAAERLLLQFGADAIPCPSILQQLSYPRPYAAVFEKFAKRNNLPLSLVFAVARTESKFDKNAVSKKDARGLLQLMPATAKAEGITEDESLFDPEVNIRLGTKHLAGLLEQYDGNPVYAIAAYNAGSSAVDRWRSRFPDIDADAWIELISYPETKEYVKRVLAAQAAYETPEIT